MKSIARCWTLPRVALGVAMIFLTGCATGVSDRPGRMCPPVVEYSPTEQARAAAEVEALPEGVMILRMTSDYAVLREQARACG